MESARRYNAEKLRYELISGRALKDLAEVYTKGAEKYTLRDIEGKVLESGANNWKKGMSWMDTIASVQRHIEAWKLGEDIDPDLKTKHLANAAWGLFTLLDFEKSNPHFDDRPLRRKWKIGLDIDGVLGDFVGHLMRVSGNEGHIPLHWNDPIVREEFEKFKGSAEFWSDIPPLLTREDIPFEPHCYITARSILPAITQEWLDRNLFPRATLYCVGAGESKIEIAKKSGIDIMVDDSYDNFYELTNAGIFTYLYDAPYNHKYDVGHRRIKNLNELVV